MLRITLLVIICFVVLILAIQYIKHRRIRRLTNARRDYTRRG